MWLILKICYGERRRRPGPARAPLKSGDENRTGAATGEPGDEPTTACPGEPTPPLSAAARPARPCDTATRDRFTTERAATQSRGREPPRGGARDREALVEGRGDQRLLAVPRVPGDAHPAGVHPRQAQPRRPPRPAVRRRGIGACITYYL
jgi:hypothetical protein